MRNQLHCRPSLVVASHNFSLPTVYWMVVSSPKERWSSQGQQIDFLLSGFRLAKHFGMKKRNYIKICHVKIILQINSDMIWIHDSLRWGRHYGGYWRTISYFMILFAQSEKFHILPISKKGFKKYSSDLKPKNDATVDLEEDQSKGNLQ